MKTTLKDIAKELNISTAAASRALNDLPGVGDDLRLRVKEAAERMGYARYLKTARVAASERSLTFIAVLYGHVGGNIIQGIQHGIDETIRQKGYSELRYMIDPDREFRTEKAKEAFFGRLIGERGIAGVLSCYLKLSDPLISGLYRRKLPIALIENPTEFGRSVTINQTRASHRAVTWLIESGRRRIGCVIPPEDTDRAWQERLAGYRQALKDHGLPYDPTRIAYSEWVGVKPGGLATRALLEQSPKLDAILYGSDTLAAGGMKMLQTLGRTVPGDVAVIGFDDEEFDLALQPTLSSVRQPLRRMAETALHLLFDSIEKNDYSHRAIELDTELVVRGSCRAGTEE